MLSIIIFLISVILVNAQHPQNAAILSDTRYQSGDGTFGASYSQDDGVTFKEESDANGDRKGSYSYVDPNGHRRTVYYTAGKNGFQASGDGIPKTSPPVAPQPEYQPLPQYNLPDYQPPAKYRPAYYAASARPEVPQSPPAYQPHSAPPPRPPPPPPPPPPQRPQTPSKFILRSKYQTEYQPEAYQSRYQLEPQYQPEYQINYQHEPQPQSKYQQYQPEPLTHHDPYQSQFKYSFESPTTPPPQYEYNEITTPSPRRFYPPGKLDFTRTHDGFSYSFNKS